MTPNGIILYAGPSILDRSPIVCIGTLKTANRKTGSMIQTWILPQHDDPLEAVRFDRNQGICGDCSLQGTYNQKTGKIERRTCYVTLAHAPLGIWRAWRRGSYAPQNTAHARSMINGRQIRLGSYGDPGAIPIRLMRQWVKWASGHTGYTHQIWSQTRTRANALAAMLMISTETDAQRIKAQDNGWRTFHVRPDGEPVPDGDIDCPYYTHRVSCEACLMCNGSDSSAKSISVPGHGAGKKYIQLAAS